jgi:hypothetical protein
MTGVALGLALAAMFIAGVLFGRFFTPNRRPWWLEFALPEANAVADARRVLADRFALGDLSAQDYAERLAELDSAQKHAKGWRSAI